MLVGERRDEVAVAAVDALGVEPLQIEERVGAEHGRPEEDLVESLLILLSGAAGAAAQNEILIDGKADDVRAPLLRDAVDFGAGDGGSGEEALLVGVGVFEAGAVDTAEEYGEAGEGVHDAVAGGAEWREVVGEDAFHNETRRSAGQKRAFRMAAIA